MRLNQKRIAYPFRNAFVPLLLLVGLSLPSTRVQAEEKILPVQLHVQHTMVWCWAASIAMVTEYMTGQKVEDCEVLTKYFQNTVAPQANCCKGDSGCVRGGNPAEIGPILGKVFGLSGDVLARSLSWNEIVSNINDRKPIIAWVWNSPQSAHVMVIVGYRTPGTVIVLDPLVGKREIPHNGFGAFWGPGEVWNISWTFTSNPAGSASPQPDAAPPSNTLSSFSRFLGLTQGATVDDVRDRFGRPVESRVEGKYTILSYFDSAVAVSIDDNSGLVTRIEVTGDVDTARAIRAKGVDEPKLDYLGKHRSRVTNDFGQYAQRLMDSYIFNFTGSGARQGQVVFHCSATAEIRYTCDQISVRWN